MSAAKEVILHICEETGTIYRATWSGRLKGCDFCAHWELALRRTSHYKCARCGATYIRSKHDAVKEE